MIELKTYAGSNVTPQNDAIMNDTNTLNNGIYYGCNVTIKDATTLHINAGQGIVYGRLFEVLDSDIPVSLSPSGTLLGQLYVHIDLSNIAAPIQILVDTGETLADLEDDPQLNIDSGITDMQLATFTVSTVGMSDLVETFKEVEPIRAVLGDADISTIGDGSVKGAIRTINTQLSQRTIHQDITLYPSAINVNTQNIFPLPSGVTSDYRVTSCQLVGVSGTGASWDVTINHISASVDIANNRLNIDWMGSKIQNYHYLVTYSKMN